MEMTVPFPRRVGSPSSNHFYQVFQNMMSLFEMPDAVIKKLDRIRRNFFWEGSGQRKKMHLMKWSEVVEPKVTVGLGLGNLAFKNWALLAKWWWRYVKEKKKLSGGGL